MASRTIKIVHAGDLQKYSDFLKSNCLSKDSGVWEVIGHNEVELNSRLINTLVFLGKVKLIKGSTHKYRLLACNFDREKKYYQQLARFLYNRKFWGLYDIKRVFAKLGYSVYTEYLERIFPVSQDYMRVKCLVIQKDGFVLILPYFSQIANLLRQNALYKQIVRIVSELYLFEPKYPYMVSLECDIDKPRYPNDAILPMLKREWNYQFNKISDKVLLWANYEEGQYGDIR